MRLESLKPFIGKWKTTGVIERSPFGPAGSLKGFDTYEWFGEKEFVIHKVNVVMGKKRVKSSEVMAFDSASKAFALYAFEKGKTAGVQYGQLKRGQWSIDGDGVRFRGRFNKSATRLVGKWQFLDKSVWKRWMTLDLKRRAD